MEKLEFYEAKEVPKAQSAQHFNKYLVPKFGLIKILHKINRLIDC
jgi:hypothetical protein